MSSLYTTLVESLVHIGVPRDRAWNVSEQLRLEIDNRNSLQAQVLSVKREVAELELKIMQEHARTQERISQCDARLNARIANSESSARANLSIAESDRRIAELNKRIAAADSQPLKLFLGYLVLQAALFLVMFKLPA
jgi:predicted RNase H-like nuclease (RuvC/YqgF family)